MELSYAYKPKDEAKIARAMGRDMNISFKHAVVISKALRGKMLNDATAFLENVINLKTPVEFKKFKKGAAHRKGLGIIGKYPEKAANEILKILRNIETNAEYKGLDLEKLKIVHIEAQKGISRLRRKPKGRWAIWDTQLVSVQVVVEEK